MQGAPYAMLFHSASPEGREESIRKGWGHVHCIRACSGLTRGPHPSAGLTRGPHPFLTRENEMNELMNITGYTHSSQPLLVGVV